MASLSEVAAEAAALAVAVDPIVASVSPAAGAVVAVVAALLKEEPALADLLDAIVADFRGKAPSTQAPLDFKDQSAAVEAQLHPAK